MLHQRKITILQVTDFREQEFSISSLFRTRDQMISILSDILDVEFQILSRVHFRTDRVTAILVLSFSYVIQKKVWP